MRFGWLSVCIDHGADEAAVTRSGRRTYYPLPNGVPCDALHSDGPLVPTGQLTHGRRTHAGVAEQLGRDGDARSRCCDNCISAPPLRHRVAAIRRCVTAIRRCAAAVPPLSKPMSKFNCRDGETTWCPHGPRGLPWVVARRRRSVRPAAWGAGLKSSPPRARRDAAGGGPRDCRARRCDWLPATGVAQAAVHRRRLP